MNTSAPDRQPKPPFAGRSPEEMQIAIAEAKKFYRADHQLTLADRENLATMFGRKMTLYPVLGLPLIFGAIMAPNYLKKAGIINPKKNTRAAQVVLGLLGAFLGVPVASKIGTVYQRASLSDRPQAQQAYSILSRYPPQLGARYYALTAKTPSAALQDPDTVDWDHELLFPLMLVLKQRPGEVDLRKGGNSPGPQSDGTGYPRSGPQQSNGPGSSWDRIRTGPSSQYPAEKSPTTPYNPTYQSTSAAQDDLETAQDQFDSMIDSVKPGGYGADIEKKQESFDKLIEREREGLGSADDFSETEKNW